MVFRLQLLCTEILNTLDLKYIDASSTVYILPPGVYEISYTKLMIKSIPTDEVKVKITTDDIRHKSNLI